MEKFNIIKEKDIENNFEILPSVQKTMDEINEINLSFLKESLINCESPIEQMLALELANLKLYDAYLFNPNMNIIGVENQSQIKCNNIEYRVDFLIPVIFYKKIYRCFIIECDGYEFHQKTKEQVKNDNIRQRNIEMSGYKVIRFSGTEIFNDSYKCALEVLDIIRTTYIQIGEEYGYKKNS